MMRPACGKIKSSAAGAAPSRRGGLLLCGGRRSSGAWAGLVLPDRKQRRGSGALQARQIVALRRAPVLRRLGWPRASRSKAAPREWRPPGAADCRFAEGAGPPAPGHTAAALETVALCFLLHRTRSPLVIVRRHPAHFLPDPDHPQVVVFLTCCTRERRRLLDNDAAHRAIVDAWRSADAWLVGRYVLMPDHVHLFCAPSAQARALSAWIGYWRSCFTRSIGCARGEVWQREFWDRQLRRGDSYEQKWDYVRMNPVRAGLVTDISEWPYQGELHPIPWSGD